MTSKFYRKLPGVVLDILMVSNGWLVGSSIKNIIDGVKPNDYDIIVPMDSFRSLFRHVRQHNPVFNNHGGIKVVIDEITFDIWSQDLESFLLVANNVDYVYNFSKNILIKREEI